MFDNKEDCCEKNFSWNSQCVGMSNASIDSSSSSTTAATSILASNLSSFESSNNVLPLYYPKEGFCVNDGIQPSYFSPSELFESEEDCCMYHYSWNSECLNGDNASIESNSSPISTSDSGTTSSSMSTSIGTTTSSTSTTTTSSSASISTTTTSTQYEITAQTSTSSEPIYSQNMLAQGTTTASTTPTALTANLDSTLTSSTSTAAATTATSIATTTELVHFDSTSSTTTAALPTTTTYSKTASAQTMDSEIPFNEFISSSNESATEEEVPSLADAFSSTSQQSMTAPIHVKDSDQSLATSYLNELSSAISNALSQDSNAEPEPKSNRVEYKLPLEPFYVDILPYNSGYKLEVRNPNQMSKAVSGYLLSYFEALDKWSYANKLIDFKLECQKSQENLGSQVKLILSCEGDGIFDDSSLPRKREMGDLIHSAFEGNNHENFLECIYSDHASELETNKEDWQQSEEEPEQRSHDPLQDKPEAEDEQINEVKQNKKDQMMLENKRQQMNDVLDDLSGKRRMLRSRRQTK